MRKHAVEETAEERREYLLFQDLKRRYHWVLPTFRYRVTDEFLTSLKERVIDPAIRKAKELSRQ